MRYALAFGISAATVLSSCRLHEEVWAGKVAKAECEQLRRCDPATWGRVYEDEGTCRDRREADWRRAALVGCVFDEVEAALCLDDLRSSCTLAGGVSADLDAPCRRVWSCGAPPEETSDTGAPPL